MLYRQLIASHYGCALFTSFKYIAGCAMNPVPFFASLIRYRAKPERLPCTTQNDFVIFRVQGMYHLKANASGT